jgi:CubicO group peptidase (beta-lactamase class C family)
MRDADWIELDRLVEDAMKCWAIPGLAIAVVQGDDTILLKGYGVRELGASAAVTPDTQFMICSLTKSINAAGIALLVDEKRLNWDTRVREILPEFQLRDPAATEAITVADLLAHRSGLPRHDRIWSLPEERSRERILDAMRYLQSSRPLREAYQYSNLGYIVAGMVAERLSGQSWEQFTTQRLLSPLGFRKFGFSTDTLVSAADFAHPHVRDGRHARRTRLWPMHATPAGGIHTCAADMARWLRLLLSRGRVDGAQIVSQAAVTAMMTPHIDADDSGFAEIGRNQYGYGLTCQLYRGERTVSHTGSLPGWGSLLSVMPDREIGVVVLTNRDPCPVRELITYAVFDRLCTLSPIDWFEIFHARRQSTLEKEEADARRFGTNGIVVPYPDELLKHFTGEYSNSAYGTISITHNTSGMRWSWRGLKGRLVYRGESSVHLKEDDEARLSDLVFTFGRNADGVVTRLRSPLEPEVSDIVFRRQLAA